MQRTLSPSTFFTEFCPVIILDMEFGPLYNFKTNADIFTKFGNI